MQFFALRATKHANFSGYTRKTGVLQVPPCTNYFVHVLITLVHVLIALVHIIIALATVLILLVHVIYTLG